MHQMEQHTLIATANFDVLRLQAVAGQKDNDKVDFNFRGQGSSLQIACFERDISSFPRAFP